MAVFTTLRFGDPFGVPLIECATYGTPAAEGQSTVPLDVTLNCSPGAIGVLETTLPTSFDPAWLVEDGRIGVWRSINGRPPYLDNGAIYQIRYIDFGQSSIFVRAFHATNLLDRRIIAYDAGTTYTTKGPDFADDLIKEYMSQQMLSGIVGADRDGVETYADVSAYLTKEADQGRGASLRYSGARRNLLDVATDLAQASTTAGTYLTFEVFAPTESTLELRTYATQRGVDRRAGTAQPVILGTLRGNLVNPHLVIDYTESANFIVAGGQGEEDLRLIGTAFDATRAAASPFGRKEMFRDATNVAVQAAVDDEADSQLRGARPLILFTGELVETPAATRGINFDLGDIVTCEIGGPPFGIQQYDVRLDLIRETINSNGRTMAAGLRSVT